MSQLTQRNATIALHVPIQEFGGNVNTYIFGDSQGTNTLDLSAEGSDKLNTTDDSAIVKLDDAMFSFRQDYITSMCGGKFYELTESPFTEADLVKWDGFIEEAKKILPIERMPYGDQRYRIQNTYDMYDARRGKPLVDALELDGDDLLSIERIISCNTDLGYSPWPGVYNGLSVVLGSDSTRHVLEAVDEHSPGHHYKRNKQSHLMRNLPILLLGRCIRRGFDAEGVREGEQYSDSMEIITSPKRASLLAKVAEHATVKWDDWKRHRCQTKRQDGYTVVNVVGPMVAWEVRDGSITTADGPTGQVYTGYDSRTYGYASPFCLDFEKGWQALVEKVLASVGPEEPVMVMFTTNYLTQVSAVEVAASIEYLAHRPIDTLPNCTDRAYIQGTNPNEGNHDISMVCLEFANGIDPCYDGSTEE